MSKRIQMIAFIMPSVSCRPRSSQDDAAPANEEQCDVRRKEDNQSLVSLQRGSMAERAAAAAIKVVEDLQSAGPPSKYGFAFSLLPRHSNNSNECPGSGQAKTKPYH
eukprot:scaffold17840_cov18-Prasinocladus_malaysianus.AAC.1